MDRGKTLSENEKGMIEPFRKSKYSRLMIVKEPNRSINVISNSLNVLEDYGTKKSPGSRNHGAGAVMILAEISHDGPNTNLAFL